LDDYIDKNLGAPKADQVLNANGALTIADLPFVFPLLAASLVFSGGGMVVEVCKYKFIRMMTARVSPLFHFLDSWCDTGGINNSGCV
jgi:hypothetical protein